MTQRVNGKRWLQCEVRLPSDASKVVPGQSFNLSGTEPKTGVVYRGHYLYRAGDRPGDRVLLHYPLDPVAPPGTVVHDVMFLTSAQLENFEQLSTAPVPGALDVAAIQRPKLKCELVLERLTSAANGGRLDLVRLRGPLVPDDLELYFCWRTYTSLQIRVKTLAKVEGLVHDYDCDPESLDAHGRGGVYELKCTQSEHQLQVKVQPALGLQALMSAHTNSEGLLSGKMYTLLGTYRLLEAFVCDPARETVSLCDEHADSNNYAARLSGDAAMLQTLLAKCTILSRIDEPQGPMVRLMDPTRARSRGILLKALFEVKVLLIQRVHFLESQTLEPRLREMFDALKVIVQSDCCPGGVGSQYDQQEESLKRLSTLVCGSTNSIAKDDAWNTLVECMTLCRDTLMPKLSSLGKASGLKVPSLEISSASGATAFKNEYTRLYQMALETYLYRQVKYNYSYGMEVGVQTMRNMWVKPDAALRLLCPSAALNEAIDQWNRDLDYVLNCLQTSKSGDAADANPRGAVGLSNPGENLCATNAMLQLLFSAKDFRDAVLSIPDLQALTDEQSLLLSPSNLTAKKLVDCLSRLFAELVDASCISTVGRDVATVLYGGELGAQQDCDELLHRLASLLQDGLCGIPGDPYKSVRQVFRRLFVGATYEVHVRPNMDVLAQSGSISGSIASEFEPVVFTSGDIYMIGYPLLEDTSNKQFLSIPVQRGNRMLMHSLEDFTCWANTGGSEVIWTQEQFRTLPPFLCFTSREVNTLEWEDSLNLTRFTSKASPSLQRDRYELAKLRQLRGELNATIQSLSNGCKSLARANILCSQQFETGLLHLHEMLTQLQLRLDETEPQSHRLEDVIGDGFEEPTLTEFLEGVVHADIVEQNIQGLLGVDTVKKLSDMFHGVDGAVDMLLDLGLELEPAQALLAKLSDRHRRHHVHMFDVHAVIMYIGKGLVGHYVAFIRQPDGAFLSFDDERITEHADTGQVRQAIADYGSGANPASVRTLVYHRRSWEDSHPLGDAFVEGGGEARRCSGADEALELPGPRVVRREGTTHVPNPALSMGTGDKSCPKRRRTESSGSQHETLAQVQS